MVLDEMDLIRRSVQLDVQNDFKVLFGIFVLALTQSLLPSPAT